MNFILMTLWWCIGAFADRRALPDQVAPADDRRRPDAGRLQEFSGRESPARPSANTIAPEFKRGAPIEALGVDLQKSDRERVRNLGNLAKADKALLKGENANFDFYRGPLSNCRLAGVARERVEQIKKTLTGPPTLDLYKVDAAASGFRGERFSPFFRYVFESRGIPVDDLAIEPTAGSYTVTPEAITLAIINGEKPDSPLAKLAKRMGTEATFLGSEVDEAPAQASLSREDFCNELRRLSLAAFGDPAKRSSVASPPSATAR